jgi:hypothetical protein
MGSISLVKLLCPFKTMTVNISDNQQFRLHITLKRIADGLKPYP